MYALFSFLYYSQMTLHYIFTNEISPNFKNRTKKKLKEIDNTISVNQFFESLK